MTQPSLQPGEPRARSRIVDVVLGVPNPAWRWRILIAVLAAASAHAALWLWAQRSEGSLEAWSADITTRVHAELSRDESIELPKPPPPPAVEQKPKAEEAVEHPAPQKIPVASRPARAEESKPPPPAQAGAIIAQEPNSNTPADLSADTFVTGTADAYAGGVTAAKGTSTVAFKTREVAPQPQRDTAPRPTRAPRPEEPDLSARVALEGQNWSCRWPSEADAEQIDEQTVVIRVVVRSDGSVESASVVSDPGHGFGQAAVACARRTRFEPARDRAGAPIRASSPPIRVRFTR